MSAEPVLVLTTFPADGDAEAFARTLVDERLTACVNIIDGVTSVYRWKDEVQQERERQLVIKTCDDRLDALRERVHALHPYDVPEFLVLPIVGGTPPYLAWLQAESCKPIAESRKPTAESGEP